MSAATTTPRAGRASAGTRTRPTFARVAASEWTKLTALRSAWWTAAVTALVAGALTYLEANASSVDPGFDPRGSLTFGLVLAQVGPLVLGVLVGTGEFRTGAFRSTFAAVPRRWPVLVAQALVTAAFALLVALLTVGASVLALLPAARSRDLTLDLTGAGTPGVLVGMVLLVVGLALFGLAVGALMRRTLPALVTGLVLVLVLPLVLSLATDPMIGAAATGDPSRVTAVGTLIALMPGTAGQLMTMPPGSIGMDGAPHLGPVGGGLVLAAWIAVPLVLAAVRLRARDLT